MLHFAGPGQLEWPPGRSGFRSMRWFRRQQGSATDAALFALLLQLALSFGHVHGGLADHCRRSSIAAFAARRCGRPARRRIATADRPDGLLRDLRDRPSARTRRRSPGRHRAADAAYAIGRGAPRRSRAARRRHQRARCLPVPRASPRLTPLHRPRFAPARCGRRARPGCRGSS